MKLSEVVGAVGGQAELARAIGCNKSYVNRAMKRGQAGPALAVRIFRKTGIRTGPTIGATASQIDTMEQLSLRRERA